VSLIAPKGSWIRPTTDRVKEVIFSYLTARISDFQSVSVLDLFAGTGSLGIEAASRGASKVVFVEQSKKSLDILNKNLARVEITAEILRQDVFRFLNRAKKANQRFGIVLCDPPYEFPLIETLIRKIDSVDLIAPAGRLVFEHSARVSLPSIGRLRVENTRKIGDTAITIMLNERT